MKIGFFLMSTAVMASALLTAVSCTKSNLNLGTGTGELRVSAPFADQTTQFAFDLAKRISAQEGPAKNIFISPLSLHIALGLLLNGANGQTAQEIQKTLKLDAQTLTEANKTYQNLVENLPVVDPKVTLALANSVWYRNTFTVENSYQDLLRQTFKADISSQDFTSPATVSTINNWASQQTNGKITNVIDQIKPENVLFLLNALYFKGDWQTQFNAAKTVDSPFKLVSGNATTVRMMRLDAELNRAFKPAYTAFELPYGSGKYAMTVLLPAQTTTADALMQSLTASEWSQLKKDMTSGSIEIGLPKFTLSYDINLNNTLNAMGMPTAFTNAADFTKMNAQGRLMLSFIKQNTSVTVDEKGTEAAAVTTGGISVTSVPLPTLCDRPFVFVIHEKTSGTVLFVGKIADPTKTSNS